MAKIIYIEDDESVRNCTTIMLKRKGHSVLPRRDTYNVDQIAEIWSPDLVITDHNLGDDKETGLKAALRLKDAGVNVVMLSGNDDAMKGAREADIPFFMKPYVISKLLDEMEIGL